MKAPYILISSVFLFFGMVSGTVRAQPTQQNWTEWQVTGDKGIDVRYDRDRSVWVTWWWQFRNRYNQKVVIHYSRLTGDGKRLADCIAVAEANGFAMDNNMAGDQNPSVQVTRVEFPDSKSSISPDSSGSSGRPSSSIDANQLDIQRQQQAALQRQQELQRQIADQQTAIDAQRAKSFAKIQSYQDASAAVQNGANQIGQILQQNFDEQREKEAAEREQAKLDREQDRLERLQQEANKTPEQRAAEEDEKRRERDENAKEQSKITSLLPSFAGTWEVDPDFLAKNDGRGWETLTVIGSSQLKLRLTDSGVLSGGGKFNLKLHHKDDFNVGSAKYLFNIDSVNVGDSFFQQPGGDWHGDISGIAVKFSGQCQESYYSRSRHFHPIHGVGDAIMSLTLGLLSAPIGIPAAFLTADRESNGVQGKLIFTANGKLYIDSSQDVKFLEMPIPLKKVSAAAQ